ncbi:hypothetical protein D3C76_1228570 [compost metagenome]
MVRFAFDHFDDAGAADAFAAFGVDVAAVGLQHVDQAGIRRHLQHHAGAGQLDFERTRRSGIRRRVRLEMLEVDVVLWTRA